MAGTRPDRPSGLLAQRLGLVALVIVVLGAVTVGVLASAPDPSLPPTISELMSSNASTIAAADGVFHDWVELHNPHAEPIDLRGWFLSDDDDRPARWQLPARELAPGGHVVVFASGAGGVDADGALHADFRLARSGAPLLLVEPDGRTVAERIPPVEIPRDASFGRDPGDPSRTCYFAFPTPGEANASECFADPDLGAPALSSTSGFYDEPVRLEIRPRRPGATVLYTVDGSYPDPERNPERTHTYDGPITIEDRSGEPPTLALIDSTASEHDWIRERGTRFRAPDLSGQTIEQATVVRARTAYSAESVATYFVGSHLVREELPVLSLALDPEHLFDHETGIYVAGRTFADWRASDDYDPDLHAAHIPANYQQRGREWERPHADDLRRAVVLEHCAPGGRCTHQRRVGVRTHGVLSRGFAQKSLRLYARTDYGAPRFTLPLFGEGGPIGHRSVLLRNSGQDNEWLMLADGYAQSLLGDFALDTQAYEPAVLFVNGEYWGIHNIRERYDAEHLRDVHGVDPRTLEVVEEPPGEVDERQTAVNEEWLGLVRGLAAVAPTDERFADEVERAIDLDSFHDFLIAQIFFANTDWIGHNVRMWRDTEPVHAPGDGVRDGRWRWLLSDLDHLGGGAGSYDVDYDFLAEQLSYDQNTEHLLGMPFLFGRMMENPELRDRFLARFEAHLDAGLDPARTVPALRAAAGRIAGEIERHAARWQRPALRDWPANIARLERFMQGRPDVVRAQLRDHPSSGRGDG